MITNEALHHEILIEASPQTIFPFFIDPQKLIQWSAVKAEAVPEPGGLLQLTFRGGEVMVGEYVEISPYERIVFTWGWEGDTEVLPPGASRVEVVLTPQGQQTLVTLKHHDLPTPMRPPHQEGWEDLLGNLGSVFQ